MQRRLEASARAEYAEAEPDTVFHRLHCPHCGAWVLEVDDLGQLVAVRDKFTGRAYSWSSLPELRHIVEYRFTCPRCAKRLKWTDALIKGDGSLKAL
jgi:hypothetical protein